MIKHNEYQLQRQICEYLKFFYPDALFLSDTIANLKLTIPQAARNKAIQKDGFKCPDLLILEPNETYKGLFIEFKIKSPYKQNGELYKDEHLEGQQLAINQLKERGYYATFSWGFEMTRDIIDRYFTNKTN